MAGPESRAPYLFGDLLALARLSWVRQMERALTAAGYPGFRRSDTAVLRALLRGPLPVGRLAQALGVSRQAARKAVAGLHRRGYATTSRGADDARQVTVALTPAGEDYAREVTRATLTLNRDLLGQVDHVHLRGADIVLRSVIGTSGPLGKLAERVPSPPG